MVSTAPKARMRAANQVNEKKVLKRGNVPTSLVSIHAVFWAPNSVLDH